MTNRPLDVNADHMKPSIIDRKKKMCVGFVIVYSALPVGLFTTSTHLQSIPFGISQSRANDSQK